MGGGTFSFGGGNGPTPPLELQPGERADGEAAIVIYVNKNAGQKPFLPDNIEGIPVTVVLTDQFIAFQDLLWATDNTIPWPK